MPKLSELIDVFEKFAPSSLAESWDNVGLQLGDQSQQVSRILFSLNASPETLKEAAEKKCQLLFTHHPLFFHSPKNLLSGSFSYESIKTAIENKISIFSAHTNLDKAENGLNKVLADLLRIEQSLPLIADTSFKKLVFFAEPKDTTQIIEKVSAAGAGTIGKYSCTSFRGPGTGTFIPEAGAKPATGQIGVLNQVEEERVEILVHKAVLPRVVEELLKAHPYEEVAYDIYPLEEVKKSHLGLGRIGNLSSQRQVKSVALDLKNEMGSTTSFVGSPERKVKRIAVIAGAGAGYIEQASSGGAELLITADVKYHEALKAQQLGLNLLATSHYALEKLALNKVKPLVADAVKNAGYTVEILESVKESDAWIEG